MYAFIFLNLRTLLNCSFATFLLKVYSLRNFCFNASFNVPCSSLLSCCCYETAMKKQLREKGFIWLKLQPIFHRCAEVKTGRRSERTNASAHCTASTVTPKPRKQCWPVAGEISPPHLMYSR